jgi:hypothetical protein
MHRFPRSLFLAAGAALILSACAEQAVAPTPSRTITAAGAHRDFSVAPPVQFAGNGHYYEAVASSLNFWSAVAAASARSYGSCTSAHLATITSAEEDYFVARVYNDGGAWWIGGYQPPDAPEPAGDWRWVTGEPFVYTNWRNSGEPNNSGPFGNEDAMYMNSGDGPVGGAFVDFSEQLGYELGGYIVEYEGCSQPNAAPGVGALSNATLINGETYAATSSFTDPDSHAWTVTASSTDDNQPTLTRSGSSFTVSEVFATPGTYTLTVTVTDDAGAAGSTTATIVVQSSAQAVGSLMTTITQSLPADVAAPFLSSLDAAQKSIQSGNFGAAANQLDAFINKTNAQAGKKLTTAQAQAMIDGANRIKQTLGAGKNHT